VNLTIPQLQLSIKFIFYIKSDQLTQLKKKVWETRCCVDITKVVSSIL